LEIFILMESLENLNIKLKLFVAFIFFVAIGCVKNENFKSEFNNEIYLKVKSYLKENKHELRIYGQSDDSLVNLVGTLYNKKEYPNLNDSLLLQTFLFTETILCGDVNATTLWYNSKTPKIMSANIENGLPKFLEHLKTNLDSTYFKHSKNPYPISINLDIILFYCRIDEVQIKVDSGTDKKLVNELYRIIYTSNSWTLDKLNATKIEKNSNQYVRNKRLSIELNISNKEVELIDYKVDSSSILKH